MPPRVPWSKAVFWAGLSGMAEIFGGVLAWLVLGSVISGDDGRGHGRGCRYYDCAIG